ncbi:hypothetical protein J2X03_003208 [Microbacterium trichothecenolyticum]|uniref:hypothetical protein n=1 Tax=Microbacterium trichothecenolyticum TaxID=69370 RepID=UPI002857912B|nr:hypothetical protein [Microbacterium trichothecenolyticum]MDR7113311.1 hypothetical protein [Microbacterium trichothecenolyticum]
MLVISKRMQRARRSDDSGAVLITVVVLMLVGFVIVAIVAAASIFTLGANATNKDRTSAFIAAESGRDVARQRLVAVAAGGACNAGTLTASVAGTPGYVFDIYTTDITTPTTSTDPLSLTGLTKSCPSATTTRVVIASTGIVNAGQSNEAKSNIATVYSWDRVQKSQPGGTVAYFDGQFKATQSDYAGDLVIRENSYECNSGSNIVGDLWVLGGASGNVGGNVEISTGCNVTGSIYARGKVYTKGGGGQGGVNIGGDIVTQKGDIDIDVNGMTIGGSMYSGHDVLLKQSGSVKNITAVGSVSMGGWTLTGTKTAPAAVPIFDPTLDRVWEITKWMDLGASNWSSQITTEVKDACSLTVAERANPVGLLDDSTTRLVLDYTACNSAVVLGAGTLTRDVVMLFAPNAQMKVSATGVLSSAASSQLMLVHIDKTLSNNIPDCGNTAKQGTTTVNVADTFNVDSLNPTVKIMVYSACGLTGQLKQDFTGQIYTNADNTTRSNHSLFTCAPMSWVPAINNLSCTIKGNGGAAGGTITTVSLGDPMVFQTELATKFAP